jgi:uncharacterized protein YdbL (DUF1318 family)
MRALRFQENPWLKQSLSRVLAFGIVLGLSGCSMPTIPVQVDTPKPIEVQVKMRVDLYQHRDPAQNPQPGDDAALSAAQARSRRRLGEIQILKNNRIVGENHLAYLSIRKLPEGDYGAYVQKVGAEENADRAIRMQAEAEKRKLPLERIQEEAATQNYHNAFSQEWVEVKTPAGGYEWQQKP